MEIRLFVLASLPGNVARIKSFFRTKKDISVSGCSMLPGDAVNHMIENPGHLLLFDDSFFNKNEVLNFTDNLRSANTTARTILYTGSTEPDYIHHLINSGITAIVNKKSERTKIHDAIRMVASGSSYIDRYYNFRLFSSSASDFPSSEEKPVLNHDLSFNVN
jgi:DNA-binding NarL/FixJ family response regulator